MLKIPGNVQVNGLNRLGCRNVGQASRHCDKQYFTVASVACRDTGLTFGNLVTSVSELFRPPDFSPGINRDRGLSGRFWTISGNGIPAATRLQSGHAMMDRHRVVTSSKTRRLSAVPAEGLASILASKIVGQPNVIDALVPCVEMFQAGLSPDNRPVGVFLLLGPTGTGKTRTVEALAEALHGSPKSLLKIDCGEYQMEHEVAKLIGAPPGYLGHRETQPALTQQKLAAAASCERD